ncbi:MAG TPA: alpha/beta hydrolase [Kribbella sp.]
MATLFLVHGGLWEPMNTDRFWSTPGVLVGLEKLGFEVLAPDRPPVPDHWSQEVEHLAPLLPAQPAVLVGASNGCSVAARLALAYPESIDRLLLAWPATAGDPVVDRRTEQGMRGRGADDAVIRELLTGETLRGITDEELAALGMPAGVLPSVPENLVHQRRTVDALLKLLPGSRELPGCPEPPNPAFSPHLQELVGAIAAFAAAS